MGAFRHTATSLLNPPPTQVPLRGCQGFTCWLGSSSFLMRGQAGGVFVAYTAGRGGGPTVRLHRGRTSDSCLPRHRGTSFLFYEKENKQTNKKI